MNWDRPVKLVKVKRYPEGIYVDGCCVEMVKRIDSLKDTYTTWCCCGHGAFRKMHNDNTVSDGHGTVEFMSKLALAGLSEHGKVSRLEYNDKDGGIRGYVIEIECHCSEVVTKDAKEHFGV